MSARSVYQGCRLTPAEQDDRVLRVLRLAEPQEWTPTRQIARRLGGVSAFTVARVVDRLRKAGHAIELDRRHGYRFEPKR